ncbi:hypothetical protein OF83DRAFT_1179485, partial [Amylostereum chailletii]
MSFFINLDFSLSTTTTLPGIFSTSHIWLSMNTSMDAIDTELHLRHTVLFLQDKLAVDRRPTTEWWDIFRAEFAVARKTYAREVILGNRPFRGHMNWFHEVLGMPDEDAMNKAILGGDIVIPDALEWSVSWWWENPDLLVPKGNTVESSLLPSDHTSALVSPKSEVEAGAMGGGSSLGGSADEESEEEDLPNFNLPSFGSPERDCQQESGFPLSLDEGGFPPPDFCM